MSDESVASRFELHDDETVMIIGALDCYRGLLLDNRHSALSDAEREHFDRELQAVALLADRMWAEPK